MMFPFRLEALSEEHERSSFRCGEEALDRYFQAQANQDIRRRVANRRANTKGGCRSLHTSGGCKERPSHCFLPTLRFSRLGQSAQNIVPAPGDRPESFLIRKTLKI
jgi:hypothetical protein